MNHVTKLRLNWLLEDLKSADKVNKAVIGDARSQNEQYSNGIAFGLELANNNYQECIQKLEKILADELYLEEDVDLSGGVEHAS